jgi:metallo-beta-lactamase class B
MRCLFTFFLSLYFVSNIFGQSNPGLKISHLTGDFYIFTSYNTYKGTVTPANGMYVVTNEGVIMIDAPWDSSQFQPLLDSIKVKHHKTVKIEIATHSHEDRAGGLDFLRNNGAKTFTTYQTDKILKESKKKRAEFTFKSDTTIALGQYKLRTYYAGEGHTKDNIVVWFEKEKVLYGGCLVKSTDAKDLGNTEEANLSQWALAINKIKRKFPNPKFVITGHQNWDHVEALDHTLNLLTKSRR